MVYTSSCGALAVLEYRVHTKQYPDDLLLYTIEFPDWMLIEKIEWTPDIRTSQRYGDVWVRERRTPVLGVKSAVVPNQWNYVLNPTHPEVVQHMKPIGRQPFLLDLRLFDLIALA